MSRCPSTATLLFLFFAWPLRLEAQTITQAPQGICPLPSKQLPALSEYQRPPDLDAWAVYIEADNAQFQQNGISQMRGNVFISQRETSLNADQASYNNTNQQIIAQGRIQLSNRELQVSADKLSYNLASGAGKLDNSNYQLQGISGRGSSEKLIQHPDKRTELQQASFTTCPIDAESWSIKAGNINLDRTQDRGIARDVTFHIKNQPVLYLPYFSFPLSDKRQSGFLIPSVSSSEKSGLSLSTPYYFNLAPNYDLTITPSLFSKRGLQVNSNFRYLTSRNEGSVTYEFLPDDREFNDYRYYFNLEHETRLSKRSQLSLNAEGVSDDQYFNDLGTSLANSSIVNLERTLRYQTVSKDKHWFFSALAQDYQVLDSNEEAYARLPQLQLSYQPGNNPYDIDWEFDSEYTYFSRDDAVSGNRIHLESSFTKRFSNSYSWFQPSVKLQHTSYFLDRNDNKQIHRSLASVALDSGLVFERPVRENQRIQTLEPRLYYTYTPFKDQGDIPVFDSSEKTLNYSNLFTENRFTGKDRIADTNRLTASLTTRFQDFEKGREIFRASIGQIYYFNDRRVTLPDTNINSSNNSELVFEASGQLNDSTRMATTAFLDTSSKSISASQVRVNYKDDKNRILNLGYNQRAGEYEAANASFALPVSNRWRISAGYEHDLENSRLLESVIGAEYQDCCWKARIAGRKYLLSDNSTYDDAIFLEFELKGLGNFGSGTQNLLRNRIYGYE